MQFFEERRSIVQRLTIAPQLESINQILKSLLPMQ